MPVAVQISTQSAWSVRRTAACERTGNRAPKAIAHMASHAEKRLVARDLNIILL
jgi:hypothetical protein